MTLFSFFKKTDKKDKTDKSYDLSQSFDHLTLASHSAQPDFVGGFYVNPSSRSPNSKQNASKSLQTTPPVTRPIPQIDPSFPIPTRAHLPPLPQPPSMHSNIPVPRPSNQRQSLTMQHAMYSQSNPGPTLGHYSLPVTPPRPYTNASIPLPNSLPEKKPDLKAKAISPLSSRPPQARPHSDSDLPSRPIPVSLPSTPLKVPSSKNSPQLTPPSTRHRASSTSVSSTSSPSSDKTVQCSGVTKAGKRCTRQVKQGPPLSIIRPDIPLERFCYQHTKDVMAPSGFYSRKTGAWVSFEEYIPDYLQNDTQVALRTEMEKARTQSDVPGYIYTYEIRDSATPDHIHLKVGRAVNLVKRLDQWDKQCGSREREQVLRGWWPNKDGTDGGNSGEKSLMKGRIMAGEKGPCCHRLERLIHLELADLVLYQPYLDPRFPESGPNAGTSDPGNNAGGANEKKKCPECGTTHKEIFSFKRITSGTYENKEWKLIVQPVIERWGDFVSEHV